MADENPTRRIENDAQPIGESRKVVKTILTHTIDYIHSLKNQNAAIQLENEELKKRLEELDRIETLTNKRKRDNEDGRLSECPSSTSADQTMRVYAKITKLKRDLEHERTTRMRVQEQLRDLQDNFFLYRRQQSMNRRRVNQFRREELARQVNRDISVPIVSSTNTIETCEAQ